MPSAAGSKRLLAAYLQSLLAYPDGCTRGETVFDPETENVLVQIPPLAEEKLYPKEQALVDLVARERMSGRRVLVYVTHTGTRDITGRMQAFLTRHGFRAAVMKADQVAPDKREAWVAKQVAQGVDVLICHPRLVQTGLDLIDLPTIVWFETDYSVYTMRQASRRSWRIGQTEPVKVVFMAYRHALQADALKLVAQKLQASLAVEGELPEDGLAAHGDEGDDLMLALWPASWSNGRCRTRSRSSRCSRRRSTSRPQADAAVGRRQTGGLTSSEPLIAELRDVTGPTATAPNGLPAQSNWLVPCGHHATGDGGLDQTSEPQQTRCSPGREFMAEQPEQAHAAAAASRSPQLALALRMGAGTGAGDGTGRRGALTARPKEEPVAAIATGSSQRLHVCGPLFVVLSVGYPILLQPRTAAMCGPLLRFTLPRNLGARLPALLRRLPGAGRRDHSGRLDAGQPQTDSARAGEYVNGPIRIDDDFNALAPESQPVGERIRRQVADRLLTATIDEWIEHFDAPGGRQLRWCGCRRRSFSTWT